MPAEPMATTRTRFHNSADFYPRAPALFRAVVASGLSSSFASEAPGRLHVDIAAGLVHAARASDLSAIDPDSGRNLLLAFSLAHPSRFENGFCLDRGSWPGLRESRQWPEAFPSEAVLANRCEDLALDLARCMSAPLAPDADGVSALEVAFENGWSDLLADLLKRAGLTEGQLVARTVRLPKPFDDTPWLHAAVLAGERGLMGALLKAGYPPDAPDRDGRTALFYARHAAMVDDLIAAGADPVKATASGLVVDEYWSSQPARVIVATELADMRKRLPTGSKPGAVALLGALERGQKGAFDSLWRQYGRDPDLVLKTPDGSRSLLEHLSLHQLKKSDGRDRFPEALFGALLRAGPNLDRVGDTGMSDGWLVVLASLSGGQRAPIHQPLGRPWLEKMARSPAWWDASIQGLRVFGDLVQVDSGKLGAWSGLENVVHGFVRLLAPGSQAGELALAVPLAGDVLRPARWLGALGRMVSRLPNARNLWSQDERSIRLMRWASAEQKRVSQSPESEDAWATAWLAWLPCVDLGLNENRQPSYVRSMTWAEVAENVRERVDGWSPSQINEQARENLAQLVAANQGEWSDWAAAQLLRLRLGQVVVTGKTPRRSTPRL